MAIAEMKKFNLAAMAYDKHAILNALTKTGAVEVTFRDEPEERLPAAAGEAEALSARLFKAEAALETLLKEAESYYEDNKMKSDLPKDGFAVSYTEFLSAGAKREETETLIEKIEGLVAEKNRLETKLAALSREIAALKIYSETEIPFSEFLSSRGVRFFLGTLPQTNLETLKKALGEIELSEFEIMAREGELVLVFAAVHKSAEEGAENAFSSVGFTSCPYTEGTGKGLYENAVQERKQTLRELAANQNEFVALASEIRDLKVYADYLNFLLEKEEIGGKLAGTEKTFFLEGYVPADAEGIVKDAVDSVTSAAYYEFFEPSEDEVPPTLMKNNKIIRNFETVTNMYSPPNYREFDPNTVMAFFYSLFLGFIMGDIGYGLIMILGGGFLWWKKRAGESGLKRLAAVFCIGGLFALGWGILFNSLFGVALPFLPTVMPNAQTDMWTFLGIEIPAVLIISLWLGIVQLMAGYVCKAVQEWRRGGFFDGLFDGLIWAIFSFGVFLAAIGLTVELNLSILTTIGGIMAGVSLLIAALTAGRKEKVLGKFTKGFGSVYGVINYASDILSYCRLYGLMLSGAVIAGIVTDYSIQFITGGNPFMIILGIVLMLAGHAFNLAMGLLSAYIHDARLQYVEFYGKFFEGEGELFAPLGSKHKYIKVVEKI